MRDLLVYLGLPISIATILRVLGSYATSLARRHRPGLVAGLSRAEDWVKTLILSWCRPVVRRKWVRAHVLKRYCRNLARAHERLTIPGRGLPLPIDECFIPLELRAGQLSEGSQLLDRAGTILILGEPGSGKTALMSRLIRTACKEAIADSQRARLPVYAALYELLPALRHRTKSAAEGAARGVDHITPNEAFELFARWFQNRNIEPLRGHDVDDLFTALANDERAGLLVVLDGLDELDSEDLLPVEAFAVALAHHLAALPGHNLLIITSRPQALDFTPTLAGGHVPSLDTVFLQPYSPAAMFSFIQRWPYRAGVEPTREALRVFKDLRDSPTLMESCSNPLFLTLYVSRDQSLRRGDEFAYGDKPETRAEFFNDAIGYLLGQRQPKRAGTVVPIVAVRRARHKFFVDLAWSHIHSNETPNRIPHSSVVAKAPVLTGPANDGVERVLMTLAKDSGIFQQNGDGTWSFVHELFLHYFVGETLATNGGTERKVKELISRLEKRPLRYVEGFYFACGLMAWRGWPALTTILDSVGNNARVAHLYPRACLEAQTYDRNDFSDNIRKLCIRWKGDRSQEQLLKDLVAVLFDYERYCNSMGQAPKVTYKGQLSNALIDVDEPEVARSNAGDDVALRIAAEGTAVALLETMSVEDAVVALYEPSLLRDLDINASMERPHVAAAVAEAALRSSFLASTLGSRRPNRFRLANHKELWVDAWPLRESPLAALLSVALPYLKTLSIEDQASFPHLFILSCVRPIRRLRYELLFGEWRVSAFIGSVSLVAATSLVWLGLAPVAVVVALILLWTLGLIGARAAVLRGKLTLASVRLLNQQPGRSDIGDSLGHRVRIVRGRLTSLPAGMFGWRPRSEEGRTYAVYDKVLPLVWRRYCPAAGDRRISRTAGASVQQMWTENVRRLIRSSA